MDSKTKGSVLSCPFSYDLQIVRVSPARQEERRQNSHKYISYEIDIYVSDFYQFE